MPARSLLPSRCRHEPKRRNQPGPGKRSNGSAVLIGDLRMHLPADRAEEHRYDAIAAGIAGHHARTTVNNHESDARTPV